MACPDYQCGFVHWNNPIPVVAAIVEHDEHIVLVRNVGWPKTWYGLVTGFLESGEMPEEGVLREVEEEIGLKPTLQSYIGMYEFHRANQLLIHYHVTVESKDVTIPKTKLPTTNGCTLKKSSRGQRVPGARCVIGWPRAVLSAIWWSSNKRISAQTKSEALSFARGNRAQ